MTRITCHSTYTIAPYLPPSTMTQTKQKQTSEHRVRMTLSAEPKYQPLHFAIRSEAKAKNNKVATLANECMLVGARVLGITE